MNPPIRSSTEINLIINKGNNAIADLGNDIIEDAKRGLQLDDTDFRDKVYQLILLRAYLKNLVNKEDGLIKAYYLASANEKRLNILLDGVVALSKAFDGPGIPLIRGKRIPLYFFPSDSGQTSGGGGSPAQPGGVTFQNLDVDAPGEVVDTIDASASEYAYYIIDVRGNGAGEGSRLDIIAVKWRGSNAPVLAEYRGADVGGSTAGVTFSAALVGGFIQLTANVPTDNWVIRGTRISFENITFQNNAIFWSSLSDVTSSLAQANKMLASDPTTTQRYYKEIPIGNWNIYSGASAINVPHGITKWKTLRVEDVIILNDSESQHFSLIKTLYADIIQGGLVGIDSINMVISAYSGAGTKLFYQNVSFQSAVINRGWITVTYEP